MTHPTRCGLWWVDLSVKVSHLVRFHDCCSGRSFDEQDFLPPPTNTDTWNEKLPTNIDTCIKKLESGETVTLSKDEAAALLSDLRQQTTDNKTLSRANKFLRRIVLALCIFSLLLLFSVMGLSYALVAVGNKMDVDAASGVMTTMDGQRVVATDSVAYKVVPTKNETTGTHCVDHVEFGELIQRVENGNLVIVEMLGTGDLGTDTEVQKLSGSFLAQDGEICFPDTTGRQRLCVTPSSDCVATEPVSGRRLSTSSYVATCQAFAGTVSTSMFGAFVSKASVCIKNKCPGSIISSNPLQYKATTCVCNCASSVGVSFAFSFSTRKP